MFSIEAININKFQTLIMGSGSDFKENKKVGKKIGTILNIEVIPCQKLSNWISL